MDKLWGPINRIGHSISKFTYKLHRVFTSVTVSSENVHSTLFRSWKGHPSVVTNWVDDGALQQQPDNKWPLSSKILNWDFITTVHIKWSSHSSLTWNWEITCTKNLSILHGYEWAPPNADVDTITIAKVSLTSWEWDDILKETLGIFELCLYNLKCTTWWPFFVKRQSKWIYG